MAFTQITVTQDYDYADGLDPAGTVSFTPTAAMANAGVLVPTAKVTKALDIDAQLSVALFANNDPATTPTGTSYLVEEDIGGATRSYYVTVPYNAAGGTVVLSALAAAPVAPTVTYVVAEGPLSLTDPRVGCLLDGAGDESAKVAAAIALLPTLGGHLYQPPGILRTGAITLDRPVRWEGAGEGASQIKAASGFTGTLFTVSAAAAFSELSNVMLAGGGSATKGLAIASPRGKYHHLHFTAFDTVGGAAIDLNGVNSTDSAHANQFSDIRILSCVGYGVYLRGFSYDCEFTNLWIGSCQVGIRYENTNGFFSNTHVWGCVGNGIELRDGNHLFANCYVETNGGSGFNLFNAARVKINGCNIWKNTGAGIAGSGTSHRLSVMGSNIYDNGTNGVQGADMLHGQVIGNQFYDDTGSANSQDRPVVTTGTSDKWIILGNTMLTTEHAVGANSLVGAANVVANNVTA